MNELPHIAFTPASLAHPQGIHLGQGSQTLAVPEQNRKISATWATNLDDVRSAQRLRFNVFAGEMGARLNTPVAGYDIDLFDDYCEHLLVRDELTHEVIGTYRVLTPPQAKRVGSTYSDTEFDLVRLRSLRDRMVELGRSCVHADYRQGAVILALWGALAEFMTRNKLDTMIGCASIPMMHNGVASAQAAAGIWHQLRQTHLAPVEYHLRPRLPLPVDDFEPCPGIEPPALIKGYLRLGAYVCEEAVIDWQFGTTDVFLVLPLERISSRYINYYGADATRHAA